MDERGTKSEWGGWRVWRFDGSSWKSWPVRPSGRFHSGLGMCLDGWRLPFQVVFRHLYGFIIFTLRSKLMAQIPKGKLVEGPYSPIYSCCAMYFFNFCLKWEILKWQIMWQLRGRSPEASDLWLWFLVDGAGIWKKLEKITCGLHLCLSSHYS